MKAQTRSHDVIVIGTGMGGGTIGRRLAEAGLCVLFVERGPAGLRMEETELNADIWDREARLVRGFWPEPMTADVDGVETTFNAPLGAGIGGSSVFYAATLERPEPHDLDHSEEMPHPTGGWPIGYTEMQPYFEEAEAQFFVRGTSDPLGQPVDLLEPLDMPPADSALFEAMQKAGLHPYQGHMALRDKDGCNSCLGRKCPRRCKMDGRSAGVEPALETGNADVLDLTEVTRINTDRHGVTSITALRNGQEITLTARAYVLAAGALASPRLFMASGIVGSSGLVGRNLMFHLNEMFALWPGRDHKGSGATKSLAFRDTYRSGDTRLGMVQAMGIEARYGEIVHFLNMAFDRSLLRKLRPLRQLTHIPAALAVRLFGDAKLFVGILEDLPYAENRVLFDPDRPRHVRIKYSIAPELRARRKTLRRAVRSSLKGLRTVFLGTGPDLNWGHPCGTLRFGNDPATSVLDRDCRTHDVENLWVADASFMPTSMGVNPSLTIAANALRVGDAIIAELGKEADNDQA
ncbi:choline dehydrogenase-like flavoprotein [Shimia isoporae]|uniref:Choline dehydrogenase-like flavoprotein n=1 Tax=Shimia isoporae TaxID=647720 RepID=A0A4R1N4P0_9RHOB|nr:GMC family oxidoreductase [Shimia isoporae]TCL00733.1 choline dehydrogenase-like flavoprotein [Shimia isoporae]